MKTYQQNGLALLGLVLMTSLTACGGGGGPVAPIAPITTTQTALGCGAVPAGGTFDRQVVGNFGAGATLTLQIYNMPNATIGAMGRISMPNIFAFLTPVSMATGPVQPLNTCLTSTTPGVLGRWNSYETIEIALQGSGVSVTMGNLGVGNETYLVNEGIEGTAQVEYTNFYPAFLTLARPE